MPIVDTRTQAIRIQQRVVTVLTALIDYANRDRRDLPIYWVLKQEISETETGLLCESETETYLLIVRRATTREIAALAYPDLLAADSVDKGKAKKVIEDVHQALKFLKTKLPDFSDTSSPDCQGKSKQWDFSIVTPVKDAKQYTDRLVENWPRRGKNFPAYSVATNPALPVATATPRRIPSNLPCRERSELIGRTAELTELTNWLADANDSYIMAIEGMGGMGKTALAMEAADRCLQAGEYPHKYPSYPRFDAIVFTAVKPAEFMGRVLLSNLQDSYDLDDLLQAIATTLDYRSILSPDLGRRKLEVYQLMRDKSILLVIDNIERVDEQTEILQFLRNIPKPDGGKIVKTIVTSRENIGLEKTIAISPLSQDSIKKLLERQIKRRGIKGLSSQINSIAKLADGSPLLVNLLFAIGISSLQIISQNRELTQQTVVNFCYETIIDSLTDPSNETNNLVAYDLLSILSFFKEPVTIEILATIANASGDSAARGIQKLKRLYLADADRQDVKPLHSLLKSYISDRLDLQPDKLQQLRSSWIEYYRNKVSPYEKEYWRGWIDYTSLTTEWKHIRSAIDFCISEDRYDDVVAFWRGLKGVTGIGGYWKECRKWLNWLSQAAMERADLPMVAEAKYQLSKTISLANITDDRGEALRLAKEAWTLEKECSKEWRFEVALYIATIHLYQKATSESERLRQLEIAAEWLNITQELQDPIADPYYANHQSEFYYSQAQLYRERGSIDLAIETYRQGVEIAKSVNYQRGIAYNYSRILEIQFNRGEFEEAEKEVKQFLPIVEEKQDRRSMAFCYQFLMKIALKTGRDREAQEWHDLAYDAFFSLGMNAEARETHLLLSGED
jgi:tetratricopeptide (TPR) repeat protein